MSGRKPAGETAAAMPWLSNLLQVVTLLPIIAFAFWLGGLSNKLEEHTKKIDNLKDVVLQSRDRVMARLAGVDAQLETISKKLDVRSQPAAQRGD